MICQKYYNSTSLHIVCALLMCLTCSCGKNANERIVSEIKAMTGRTIVFPNGYQTISCDKTVNMKKCLQKDIKIVSYIDYLSCTQCGINMMMEWIDKINEINPNVEYILVVNTDLKHELDSLVQQNDFYGLIMYYSTDTFITTNNLDVMACNKTFLLDKNNKIVLVGEPWDNKSLAQLYSQTIDSLRKTYENHKCHQQ
ncbi:MAG: hypothetical protein KBT06_08725 [Prevotellaceae bacterium]|nr:hypothetical protein [Candidatus Colivivens equi]